MKIGVLGTGVVGQTLASKLLEQGHEVTMGSRTAENEKAHGWASRHPHGAKTATFADAARSGELIFLAIKGDAWEAILQLAGYENFSGKIVIDVSNPLDFSKGFPPTFTITNTNSLGEEIQKMLPEAKIVKVLNTITADLMTHPEKLPEETDLFMCGNDQQAKQKVRELLESFGWKRIIDLGDISNSRGTEQLLALWIRLYAVFGSANFNFKIVRG
jgi:NADPH-dependent F420 reductase